METTVTTGTTLAILAPYLPYGVEVETGIGICRILEIDFLKNHYPVGVCTKDEWENGEINGRTYYSWTGITPILRPFSDLVKPLPDGTVPAVEVAKMMLARVTDPLDWDNALVNEDEDRVEVQIPVRRRLQFPWLLHIEPDYTISCCNSAGIEKDVTAWRAIDYLRSQHFAVGLEPSQFIPKQD